MYYLQDDTVMVGSLNEVSDNVYDASFGPLQCLPLEYWFTVNDTKAPSTSRPPSMRMSTPIW